MVGKDHGAHSDHKMTKWPFQTALVLQDELSRELGEGQRTLNGKPGDLGLLRLQCRHGESSSLWASVSSPSDQAGSRVQVVFISYSSSGGAAQSSVEKDSEAVWWLRGKWSWLISGVCSGTGSGI